MTHAHTAESGTFEPKGAAALPKLIGLICCLVALAASIIAKVDPASALIRAVASFFAGSLLTQIWYVFFATQVARPSDIEEDEAA